MLQDLGAFPFVEGVFSGDEFSICEDQRQVFLVGSLLEGQVVVVKLWGAPSVLADFKELDLVNDVVLSEDRLGVHTVRTP